jgi:hypothetical protein
MNFKNLSPLLQDTASRYPKIPPVLLLKIDAILRGVLASERAEALAKKNGFIWETVHGDKRRYYVDGIVFPDGLSLEKPKFPGETAQHRDKAIFSPGTSPYLVDDIDGLFWLTDDGKPIEQLFFSPIPRFFGKKTSNGTPMESIAESLPSSCLSLVPYGYCYFWNEKIPCKYCNLIGDLITGIKSVQTEETLQDITETVTEAIKEEGRWQIFRLHAGSDPRGDVAYERETEEYVKVLEAVEKAFGSKDFNGRFVGSALNKDQWKRTKEAGNSAVEPHIEVWDKRLFDIICPGKAKWNGYDYWLQSALDAVEVFGRGNVCSQVVGGIELAKPYGFASIDEALDSTLAGVEFFAERGVTMSFNVLRVRNPSVFYKEGQTPPPIEYYARLTTGMHEIRKKHRIPVGFNDYRRCSAHPDTILSRLDYPQAAL